MGPHTRLHRFGAALLLSAIGACGGAPSVAPDAGAADGSTVDRPAARRYRAVVMLERWARADPRAEHTIAAVLSFNTDGSQPFLRDVDARCRYHERVDWTATQPPPDYGTFHLAAPAIGEATFTEASGYEPSGGALGWDTGAALRVWTTGGEVPAFSLDDTVPAQASLTSHDLSALRAQELVIPRDSPFALRWTPAPTEVFALVLQFDEAASPQRGLWCFFPGAEGSASIPVAALSHLLDSSGVAFTNFYFSGVSRRSRSLERVDVEMVTWKGQAARILVR